MAWSRFPVWLMAALLALVTMALYWPAMRCDFVNFDDPDYVTANQQVQGGLTWAGVKWAFLNPVSCNWHPLTVLSHIVDCQLFGLKPWGHHLTSVLLHALNAVLVFALLQQMTGATVRSLFVAALFAVHPLRVESVAWVAERKDVLSGFFGLLALIFYARYVQVQRPASRFTFHVSRATPHPSTAYLLSLCFFTLGLMSKPMLVTWPFVMLLLDYWPLERFQPGRMRHLLREKIPFFVLAAVASAVTFVVQQQEGAVKTVQKLPLGARYSNALLSYCRYLEKLFWPADLAVLYPHPGHWPLEGVLLAGGLLVSISALLLVERRRYPFLLMGWLWYCGTLAPVIGLVQVGEQAMADRYTYLPSVGVLIVAIWGMFELTRRWRHRVPVLLVAGSAAIVLHLALTWQQLGYWRDSEALFRHALEVTGNSYLAHNNLATALLKKGQTDEAIRQYQEAIRLKRDFAVAHNNLGKAFLLEGREDDAIAHFQEALAIQPTNAPAHNNLATLLLHKGQVGQAMAHYQAAVELQPDNAAILSSVAWVLATCPEASIRNGARAVELAQHAARLSGRSNTWILTTLAAAYAETGQFPKALANAREALVLVHAKPNITLSNLLQTQIGLYEAGSAFRDPDQIKASPEH